MTSSRSDVRSGGSIGASTEGRDPAAGVPAAPKRREKGFGFVGWILLLLAAVLRFATIDTRGFWLDEAITVEQTRLPSVVDVIMGQIGNVHPPLFHVTMHLWTSLFGYSEVAMRSMAATFGLACIPLAFLAGRRLYSRRVGLIAAAIVAVSPYYIWYAQEARMYSMLAFFAFASMAALASAMRDNKTWHWIAYTIVSILGLYTHFFFLFLVFGQAMGVLAVTIRHEMAATRAGTSEWTHKRPWIVFRDVPQFRNGLISVVVMAVAFSGWVFRSVLFLGGGHSNALVTSATGSGLGYGQTPPELAWRLNDVGKMLIEMLLGFHPNWVMFALVAMWPVFITVLLVMLDVWRPLAREALWPLVSVLGLVVIAALGQWQGQVLASRYAIAVAAPVVLVAAAVLDLMPRKLAATFMVVAAIVLAGMWVDQSYNPDNAMRHDNRKAIDTIVANYRAGDIVVYEPFYTGPVFDYYLPQRIPSYAFPQYGKYGVVRRAKAELSRDLDRTIGPKRRVWLMLSYQDIKTVAGDANVTVTWFIRSGFRVRLDRQYNNVRLMLFEVETPRPGWDFQERRVR